MKKKVDKIGRHIRVDSRAIGGYNFRDYLRNKPNFSKEVQDTIEEGAKRLKALFPQLDEKDILSHLRLFRELDASIAIDAEHNSHRISGHNTWFDIVNAHREGFRVETITVKMTRSRSKTKTFDLKFIGPNYQVFEAFLNMLKDAPQHLRPSKITSLPARRVNVIKKLSPLASELKKILSKKERVYDYLEMMLQISAPKSFGDSPSVNKALRNHLTF